MLVIDSDEVLVMDSDEVLAHDVAREKETEHYHGEKLAKGKL